LSNKSSRAQTKHTITSGAITQFTTTLNKICVQISLFPNTLCNVSYRTLHRIGYIITSKPTATISKHQQFIPPLGRKRNNIPIGTLTPTNFPFCNAGPVFGTKFPRIIPTAIARKIHRARNRSSQPRLLKMDSFSVVDGSWGDCFSMSDERGERWISDLRGGDISSGESGFGILTELSTFHVPRSKSKAGFRKRMDVLDASKRSNKSTSTCSLLNSVTRTWSEWMLTIGE
jgi:hypothetical protein